MIYDLARAVASFLLMLNAAAACAQTSPAERETALNITATLIADRYVDPTKGRMIAQQLRADITQRRFADSGDDVAFSRAVMQRLRALSDDGHFDFVPQQTDAAAPPSEAQLMERWYGTSVNHGFAEVRRLDNGVGYLNLTVFAPVDRGGDLASAAMSLLAQSPALIVDLRQNGGGMEEMVLLLAAYLLDETREMSALYDRPRDQTQRRFTPSWVAGRRFGEQKPVVILVSHRTFSAAEQFAYDLKAMGRAVIIGEQTGGGAHPSELRPVGPHFLLTLPEGRSINPITHRDWEGVGVTPDIVVPADEALSRALQFLAQRNTP